MKGFGEISKEVVAKAGSVTLDLWPNSAPAKRVDASNLPAAFDVVVDRDIPDRVWSGWIPRAGSRLLRRELRLDERSLVTARAAQLRPALEPFTRPAEDDRVAVALAEMFGGFTSMRERDGDVLGKIHSAMLMLSGFPAWAIEQGCAAVRAAGYKVITERGSYTERHWPPSDSELQVVVGEAVAKRRSALASAEALLAAPVEPPPPPRPSREEIEAKLGRPLPAPRPTTETPPDPPIRGDGKHMARVMADLESRRARPVEIPAEQPDA